MAYASITKPSLHFNNKIYAGTGSSNSITGVGFQPDFTWIKSRDNGSNNNHMLFDAIRGATKYLKSDANSAENTLAETLKTFDSDGFTVGTQGDVNQNNINFASWNWKASGSTASNSNGSINSTVSVNTTAGFSIVSWTGNGNTSTIGHGLGVTPSVIILKNRSIVEDWPVYHKDLTVNNAPAQNVYLHLNNNNAGADYPVWNDTAPTSSVFSVGGYDAMNGNGNSIIAYCFAEKKGYSKFGKYTSNNTANDGPFIYTGFKPAFVLTKITSTGGANWRIFDNKRDGFNGATQYLQPNTADDESNTSPAQMDLLSNGFKLRGAEGDSNYNTETLIYMAFAEEPLVANVGNSIPATAR